MSLQDEINKLQQEKAAIQEEFTSDYNSTSPENIKKRLTQLIPDALTELENLLKHAESEGVRFSASKYVLTLSLDNATTEDALRQLMNELRPSDPQNNAPLKNAPTNT